MNGKAFFITISVLFIIMSGMFSSCGELVPEYEGRINPNDPYNLPVSGGSTDAVKNVNFSLSNMGEVYWNVELADFSSWDAGAPTPQFYLIVFSNGAFDSIPDGKNVLAGYDYAAVASDNNYSDSFQLDRIDTTGLIGASALTHTLAVFWTDEYLPSMATLSDADPFNDDFSGNWIGPVTYTHESTIIVAGSGGALDDKPSKTFGGATFNVDQIAGSYGLLGFDFDSGMRFDSALLYLSCRPSAEAGSFEWSLYDRIWDAGAPAATLYNDYANFLGTYPFYGSMYLSIEKEFLSFEVTSMLNDWAASGGTGIALIPQTDFSRVFYGVGSNLSPYLLLITY